MTYPNRKLISLPIIVMGAVCLAYLLPYCILGTGAHIMIWDNLDSNVSAFKVLAESGMLFSSNSTLVPQIFNGIPRGTLPSELNVTTILYLFFSPYSAYVVDRSLMMIIGFFGTYLLLSSYFIANAKTTWLAAGVAAGFAVLPFWPPGLSVAGTPFLLYAFLNLRSGHGKLLDWVIIAIYPFCASLVATGFFFMVVVAAMLMLDFYHKRKLNWNVLLGLAVLSILFVCSHYRLFLSFFLDSGYQGHRSEFYEKGLILPSALKQAVTMGLRGQAHTYSLHTYVILPAIALAGILMFKYKKMSKPLVYVGMFLASTSLFYGLWQWVAIYPVKEVLNSILPMQLQRFHWLHPMFWFIAFGIALFEINNRLRIGRYIAGTAIVLQILYGFYYHENFLERRSPTYSQFYAVNQFSDIQKYINQPQSSYRVVSLGIHPSIALFNWFYVLDGYFADYPLQYKHQFRKVIARELDKNEKAKEYYDWWGSRVYIFASELWPNYSRNYKGNECVVKKLDLDFFALYSMGGRYLLSAVKIDTKSNPNIVFLKKFEDDKSAWDIYLYKIEIPHPPNRVS